MFLFFFIQYNITEWEAQKKNFTKIRGDKNHEIKSWSSSPNISWFWTSLISPKIKIKNKNKT